MRSGLLRKSHCNSSHSALCALKQKDKWCISAGLTTFPNLLEGKDNKSGRSGIVGHRLQQEELPAVL